jgi:antitoxin VapB
MRTAKLFKNGRSQAVRLPKDFRFEGEEVYVKKIEGGVMLLSKADPWAAVAAAYEIADLKNPIKRHKTPRAVAARQRMRASLCAPAR